jgi:hypothetical protein
VVVLLQVVEVGLAMGAALAQELSTECARAWQLWQQQQQLAYI